MKSLRVAAIACWRGGDRPGRLGACAEHGGESGCAGTAHRHADREGVDADWTSLDAVSRPIPAIRSNREFDPRSQTASIPGMIEQHPTRRA